jgi:Peptidase inhibitor I78 family
VIQYGMAVTMDYSATRLNIWLDRRDVIERVTCG